jgi:hypothetical protein
MLFKFETMELEDGFSILTITMDAQTKCMINTDDFFDEMSETIGKKYKDFCRTCNPSSTFYTIHGVFDSIIKDIEEVINYFNVLNDKIVSLDNEMETKEEEDMATINNNETVVENNMEVVNMENLTIKDYTNMVDAMAKEMKEKVVKEANLSKEEINEQIDEEVKSFVADMGILGKKVLQITGIPVYANRIGVFCDKCREKNGIEGIFDCARELRKEFLELIEDYKKTGKEDNFKKAIELEKLFGDDQKQGAFGVLMRVFFYIYYRIKNFFKNTIQVNIDDNSIFGKIIEGASLITGLIVTGVKIVFSVIGHIASFVITTVTKTVVKLYDAIKGVIDKIKNSVKEHKASAAVTA